MIGLHASPVHAAAIIINDEPLLATHHPACPA